MIDAVDVRGLLSRHGVVRSQPVSDWTGDFQLPEVVERFYREVGPVDVTIEGTGNPYFLPSLAALWDFQAGYRWDGNTGERVDDWDDDWLVVGDEAGDPFILSRSSGCILLAEHGQGVWDPEELFDDLNSMAASLAILGAVALDAGGAFLDEDFNILPTHRSLAVRRLTELLGTRAAAECVLGALGWG